MNYFAKPKDALSTEQQSRRPFSSGLLRKPVDPKRIRINPDGFGVQIKKTAAQMLAGSNEKFMKYEEHKAESLKAMRRDTPN
jgi:hypothetical protein